MDTSVFTRGRTTPLGVNQWQSSKEGLKMLVRDLMVGISLDFIMLNASKVSFEEKYFEGAARVASSKCPWAKPVK